MNAFWIIAMTVCINRVCHISLDTFDSKFECDAKASWVHLEMLKKGKRMKPTCIPSWNALNLEFEK